MNLYWRWNEAKHIQLEIEKARQRYRQRIGDGEPNTLFVSMIDLEAGVYAEVGNMFLIPLKTIQKQEFWLTYLP